jgi:predicted GH43/DUF377 family glycosyl hydrolase
MEFSYLSHLVGSSPYVISTMHGHMTIKHTSLTYRIYGMRALMFNIRQHLIVLMKT